MARAARALSLQFATSLALLVALASASNGSSGNPSSSPSLGSSLPGGETPDNSAAAAPDAACLLWEGEGCNAIHDRETCLGKRDGRPWTQWDGFAMAGEPCAWCDGEACVEDSDALCMPRAWVDNRINVTTANCSREETAQSVAKMLSAIWESPIDASSSVRFEPGASNSRCVATGMEESEHFNKFYWTFTAVSRHQCQGICASKSYCKGFQFDASRHECQVWWRAIDSVQEVPAGSAGNFSCLRVLAVDAEDISADSAVDNQSAEASLNLSAELPENSSADGNTTSQNVENLSADAPQLPENSSSDGNTTSQNVENLSADAPRNLSDESNATLQNAEHVMASALQEHTPDSNATAEAGLTDQQKAAIGGAVGGVAGAALVGGLLGGLLPNALATHTTTFTVTTTMQLVGSFVSGDGNASDAENGDNLSDSLFNATIRVLHPESDAKRTGPDGKAALVGKGDQARRPSWVVPLLVGAAATAVAMAFACGFAHHSRRSVEFAPPDLDEDLESQASSADYGEAQAAQPPARLPSSRSSAACQPSSARLLQAQHAPAVFVRSPPHHEAPPRQAAEDNWGLMLASVFRRMPREEARSTSPTPGRAPPHSYTPLAPPPQRPGAASTQLRATASASQLMAFASPQQFQEPFASPGTPISQPGTPLSWRQTAQTGLAMHPVEPVAWTPRTPLQPPRNN